MNILITLIYYALILFEILLFARVILSFFPNIDRGNPLIRLVYDITEPVLKPIRDLLPPTGIFDFSVLIAFLIVNVLITLIVRL
jgi:YggT family protein